VTHPYADAAYAAALAFAGRPLAVPAWESFVLARPIAAGGEDALGLYPRAVIAPGADLAAGLASLAQAGLVSVVLVADPLAAPPPDALAAAFSLCRPFKTHQLIDRAKGYAPTKHHRYEIKRANARCRVERVALAEHLVDWRRLYDGLTERHAIAGMAAFSDSYFQALADWPVFGTFVATVDGEVAAMAIWFEHAGAAYNHLGASSAAGYANGASYALYDAAVAHFSGAAVLDLGAGAGLEDDPEDGLARFKRGFANAEVTAYLCGAVLDEGRYVELTGGRPDAGFFPAYRQPPPTPTVIAGTNARL
jgi:hypothetical protein